MFVGDNGKDQVRCDGSLSPLDDGHVDDLSLDANFLCQGWQGVCLPIADLQLVFELDFLEEFD